MERGTQQRARALLCLVRVWFVKGFAIFLKFDGAFLALNPHPFLHLKAHINKAEVSRGYCSGACLSCDTRPSASVAAVAAPAEVSGCALHFSLPFLLRLFTSFLSLSLSLSLSFSLAFVPSLRLNFDVSKSTNLQPSQRNRHCINCSHIFSNLSWLHCHCQNG
jgi:hypothetical protein